MRADTEQYRVLLEEAYGAAWAKDAAEYRKRAKPNHKLPAWTGASTHANQDSGLRKQVLDAIGDEWITRAEIQEATGLSRSQVSNALYAMTVGHLIETKTVAGKHFGAGVTGMWRRK